MKIFFLSKRNRKIEKSCRDNSLEVVFIKRIIDINELKNIKQEQKDYDAVLIETKNVEILRRMIDKIPQTLKILVLGTNDMINRASLEHKRTDALVSPEYSREYDFINYRNSGLNQVLCKIARDNKKEIIENYMDLLGKERKEKSLLLGRFTQNSKLCKKYKVSFIITIFTDDEQALIAVHELQNLQRVLLSSL